MTNIELSKFLSYVLRHKPEKIGITLDSEGWVEVAELKEKAAEHGQLFDQEQLLEVVETSDKKRFTLSYDNALKIRAAQGHSTETVAITYTPKKPPAVLYHGTAEKHVKSIKKQGLIPGNRHHVHLSADISVATTVGTRHGKPVIFTIQTQRMLDAGYKFYQADNGVWLTEQVPPTFLS